MNITPALDQYDNIIVYFSGGKDSLACLLHLFELGADKSKIELWHHDVDGREGSDLMDWACTPDYCRKVAEAFGLPIYFSWKVGGFEGEMLRENSKTLPTKFETPEGQIVQVGGTRGKNNTRLKFPQTSADLSVRWCSAYLKIDVGAAALRNQKRFERAKTLTVSGERAEESAARSRYKEFEPDRTDLRNGKCARHVDRWRPVHSWTENQVWEIIEKYGVNPHPAYHLGWGRVSCLFCIFGSDDQWASGNVASPKRTGEIILYEGLFETTIHRSKSVSDRIQAGTPYQMDKKMVALANSKSYTAPIILKGWSLPSGAYGESCGPI